MNWEEILKQDSDATTYHTREWTQSLAEIHKYEPILLENRGAIFPLSIIRSRLFGNRMISVPFGDYGGPCGDVENAERLIDDAILKARQARVNFIEIRAPTKPQARLLEKKGFEQRTDYHTFILDLTVGIESLWKNIEKRTRNGVTHAKKQNINLRNATYDDLESFYSVYLKTMKRLGSPPQPLIFFKKIWLSLQPKGLIRICLAETENELVSAAVFFPFAGKMHYAYSCSLEEMRHLRVNDLLLWNAISAASDDGFREFDFGRTRRNSGVFYYKKGWGGKEKELPYFYKFFGKPLEERQEKQYELLSRVWKAILPSSAAKALGPHIIRQIG
ncbi:hypothetical protein AUJ65_02210 [Candidatus Micrarchaeota archaeon CG1_02_51_15]|nr:MAG: hypothetical protein AUJ65_02210 [Candidatus Micrarchaeota archaeon CG1_02_51_15]